MARTKKRKLILSVWCSECQALLRKLFALGRVRYQRKGDDLLFAPQARPKVLRILDDFGFEAHDLPDGKLGADRLGHWVAEDVEQAH